MSEIEPVTVYSQEWSDDGNFSIRAESYYPDEVLDEMARRVGNELDEEIIRRLGYVKPVRCRDCRWAREATPQGQWHLECRLRPLARHYTDDGGFCHMGERRDA